jgi:periplasmic divalent cation tolerance protein
VKTRAERYPEVEAAIRAASVRTSEILAVPVVHGFAPYLDWIAAETVDT